MQFSLFLLKYTKISDSQDVESASDEPQHYKVEKRVAESIDPPQ